MGYFKGFFSDSGKLGVPMLEEADAERKRQLGERLSFTDGKDAVTALYLKASVAGISSPLLKPSTAFKREANVSVSRLFSGRMR